MNVTKLTSRTIVVLLTGLWSAGLFAARPIEVLQQTGLSSYSSLGTEQFIASLYTDNREHDAVVLLNSDMAVSMEIRVTAEQISQRRFARLWIESVTVNSDARQMAIHVGNFSRFSDFLKGPLHRGDRLLIAYTPEQGMRVELNNTALGRINSGDFFRLLLHTWIGPIPLSSNFRKQLLAPEKIDPQLRERFNALKPNAARLDEVKGWASAASATPRPKPAQEKADSPTDTSAAAAPPATPAIPADTGGTAALNQAGATPTQDVGPSATENTQPRAVPTTAAPATAEQPRQGQAQENAPINEPEATAEPHEQPPAQEDNTLAEEDSDLLQLQQYYTQLSRKIRKYQTLPRQAFQRRLEGTVRISVTVDRGGRVVNVQLAERSPHKVLNEQAFAAVESAIPFPPLPSQVSGERYTFSVDLEYRLPY